MFDHLRFNGEVVAHRSKAGQKAEQLLDLNDPDAVAYRRFVLDTLEVYDQKKLKAEKSIAKVNLRLKEGRMTAAIAAQAIAEFQAELTALQPHLNRLSGVV